MSFAKRSTNSFLAVFLLVPALFLSQGSNVSGQIGIRIGEDEDVDGEGGGPNFLIASNVKLGFSGFETSYHFAMRDENGYTYDLMKLLNPSVAGELGLTTEQIDEIDGIKGKAMAELTSLVALAEDDGEKGLRARFAEAENDIRGILNEQQLTQLEQIKHRNAIRQVGLAKHLSSSHFESPISDEDAKALEQVSKDFAKMSKKRALDLLKAANKKLLGELTAEQQQKFESTFDSDFSNSILEAKMFTQSYSPKKKLAKRKTDLYRILKVKNLRTSIGLSDDEYADIKELDPDQRGQITEKLTAKQKKKLDEKVVSADIKRMGTVNSIAAGYIRKVLNLEDDQAQHLHESGREINAELMKKLKAMKKEVFKEAMSPLSDSLKETIGKAIGEYAITLPEKE